MNKIGTYKLTVNKTTYHIKCSIGLAQWIEEQWNRYFEKEPKKTINYRLINALENGLNRDESLYLTSAILAGWLEKDIEGIRIAHEDIEGLSNQILCLIAICAGGEEFGKKLMKIKLNYEKMRQTWHLATRNSIDFSGLDCKHMQ